MNEIRNLSGIFCQDKAVETLRRAFSAERIPHAYIFAGQEGIGKFTTALAWSRLLLCKSPLRKNGSAEACSECDCCRSFDAGSHPDFHHIYKELNQYASDPQIRKRTPIDLPIIVIREFVIDKARLKPSVSASRVFVISEAEKLSTESQNSLLKILEEPPEGSFIILLCTKLDSLLPTTRSRCQIVNFGPVSEEKIIAALSAAGVNKQQAKFWARLTAGSIGRSELFSKLEPSFYETKKQILQRLCDFKLSDAVDFAQWLNTTASQLTPAWQELTPGTSKSDIGRQIKKTIISVIISAFDDAMKSGFTADEDLTNFDQPQQTKVLAGKFGPRKCAGLIENCFEANRFIDASVNEKLIFENLLLSMNS